MNHQFTSPITYSHNHQWLISSVYDKVSAKSNILLWTSNDLQTRNKVIAVDTKENEQIIRIFHSRIC